MILERIVWLLVVQFAFASVQSQPHLHHAPVVALVEHASGDGDPTTRQAKTRSLAIDCPTELGLCRDELQSLEDGCTGSSQNGPLSFLLDLIWDIIFGFFASVIEALTGSIETNCVDDLADCENSVENFQCPTTTATEAPIAAPTSSPTSDPTSKPSPISAPDPTLQPTAEPSPAPTSGPMLQPTTRPTQQHFPITEPSPDPTQQPTGTAEPSPIPSSDPTLQPTAKPSPIPTSDPTLQPTAKPSPIPTSDPTLQPTAKPSPSPTSNPTLQPTDRPSPRPMEAVQLTTTFYAIGDVPYTENEATKLTRQMQELPTDGAFLVHVGDIRKDDDKDCERKEYSDVASILRLSRIPVFVLLGDNDWTDCPNRVQAFGYWKDEFLNYESRYWNHGFDITHQPGYEENFSFVYQETLFIGLNIVGGSFESFWTERLTDQLEWTIGLIRSFVSDVSA